MPVENLCESFGNEVCCRKLLLLFNATRKFLKLLNSSSSKAGNVSLKFCFVSFKASVYIYIRLYNCCSMTVRGKQTCHWIWNNIDCAEQSTEGRTFNYIFSLLLFLFSALVKSRRKCKSFPFLFAHRVARDFGSFNKFQIKYVE